MWMVHEILHAMFESKERRFCWVIHVSTEAYYDILKVIASLERRVTWEGAKFRKKSSRG